jgi:hypothetical protein
MIVRGLLVFVSGERKSNWQRGRVDISGLTGSATMTLSWTERVPGSARGSTNIGHLKQET